MEKHPTYETLIQKNRELERENREYARTLEKQVRDSEEKFKRLFESCADGIAMTSPGGDIIATNLAFQNMLGYSEEELRKLSYRDITPEEWIEPELRLMAQFGEQNGINLYEKELIRKDGSVIPVEISVWSIADCEESALRGAFVRDVSIKIEQRKALEANRLELKKNEERLRLAISAIKGGIWDLTADLTVPVESTQRMKNTYFSTSLKKIIGIKPGEPLTNTIMQSHVHPDDKERVLKKARAFESDGGQVLNDEYRMIHKDGRVFWVRTLGRLTMGESYRRWTGVTWDITEYKLLEEALRKSENEKSAILNGIRTQIRYLDPELNILWANDAACDAVGKQPDEIINRKCYEIWGPDPGKPCDNCASIEILREGQTESSVEKTADGKIWDFKSEGIYDEGKLIGIVEKVDDITEKHYLEKQLQQSQKMEAIGTLAGGIAHDFNNILGAIFGYTQLAQRHSADNPKVKSYIDKLYKASVRAKELVQQILAFSRNTNVEMIPVDIGIIIKEALSLLRASIPSTIEIHQNVKEELGTVKANQTQIHQIVMNLCANAFQAMEKDGGKLSIDLQPVTFSGDDSSTYQTIKTGDYLQLSITDTGHGMDAKTISHIFDPYFTTKDPGEGTGMGLATVHGIVKSHGGEIKVYSEPGVGTTFHVLLPLIDSVSEKAPKTPEALPGGDERILFVDDEMFLVDIARELLKSLGYQVETCRNPHDALETFRKQPDKYDLVITDMIMPKMTGDKLTAEIKKIRSDIPVILCTGFSRRIDFQNAGELGISHALMKPLTVDDLAKSIRKVLDEPFEI